MNQHHSRLTLFFTRGYLIRIIIGVIFILFILIYLLLRSANSAFGYIKGTPISIPLSTITVDPELRPDQLTAEGIIYQTRIAVTIPARNLTSGYDPPTALPVTPAPWDIGSTIYDSGDAPFPGMAYAIVNRWQGMVNDLRTVVYAGGLRDDPGVSISASQGFVAVISTSRTGRLST